MPDASATGIVPDDLGIDRAFAVFDQQDSGCVSYGVTVDGADWFVKTATTAAATKSLEGCLALHRAVRHPAIVRPTRSFRNPELTLLYPWVPGRVLNHATTEGSDRSALHEFRQLPIDAVVAAIEVVVDAHHEITGQGFVAVDFYDGCLLYDFDARTMRLIDLDEYRPGPFTLDAERLPGSTSYMAPEEFRQGALIDQRTTVHGLGRMIHHLLDGADGWRGTEAQATVVERATHPAPEARHRDVRHLANDWTAASRPQ